MNGAVADGDVAEVLDEQYETDAHVVGYLSDAIERLNMRALAAGAKVTMRWLILEVDHPKALRVDGRAPEEWFASELPKIERLLTDEPGAAVWRSRGGYRLIAALPEPFPIDSVDAGRAWSRFVVLAGAAVHQRYGILVDAACRDWTRLQRAPLAMREVGETANGGKRLEREPGGLTCGADTIGAWDLSWLPADDVLEQHAHMLAVSHKSKADEYEVWAVAVKSVFERGDTGAGADLGQFDLDYGAGELEDLVTALLPSLREQGVGNSRHTGYLALCGALAARGVRGDALELVVGELSRRADVDDEQESRDREAAARTTEARIAGGQEAAGLTKLRELWPDVASAVERALGDPQGDKLKSAFLDAANDVEDGVVLDPRPVIFLGTDEFRVVAEVMEALKTQNGIYNRGGRFVVVVPDEADLAGKRKRVIRLERATIRTLISSCCALQNWNAKAKGYVDAYVPGWLADAVYAEGTRITMPILAELVDVPVLRADGSLVTSPGYDATSRTYLAPTLELPAIPDAPTREEARAALDELLDIVCDVPFATKAGRSAWVAALLTQFVGGAVNGARPAVIVDANVRAAGKTMLVDTIAGISIGEMAPKTPQSMDGEEARKQITSAVLAGASMLVLDNIKGSVGGPVIDAFITNTGRWTDRVLGGNDRVNIVTRMQVFMTGNNLNLSDDIVRRALYVRLDSADERPEMRIDFKRNEEPPVTALRERARYVVSCLTVLKGWYAAGQPVHGQDAWGSFEAWGRVVRGALVWLGETDPAESRRQLQEDVDEEPDNIAALFDGLGAVAEMYGTKAIGQGNLFTAADVVAALPGAFSDSKDPRIANLRDALGAMIGGRNNQPPTSKAVGYLLRSLRNRPHDGMRVEKARMDGHTKVSSWRLARTSRK